MPRHAPSGAARGGGLRGMGDAWLVPVTGHFKKPDKQKVVVAAAGR